MKISFVIPAYNEEERIADCLDSIMHEVDRTRFDADIEIVVVNNASTDGTRAVALRYPGVRVVDELAKGLVKARARGFAASTGELVANVDSDTIVPPGWTKKVIREFERDPNLVCLSGPLAYYDLSGREQFIAQLFQWFALVVHLVFRTLRIGAQVQGGNFVLRRAAWEHAGGFDTTIDFYGEDADVGRRMIKQGKVKYSLSLPAIQPPSLRRARLQCSLL